MLFVIDSGYNNASKYYGNAICFAYLCYISFFPLQVFVNPKSNCESKFVTANYSSSVLYLHKSTKCIVQSRQVWFPCIKKKWHITNLSPLYCQRSFRFMVVLHCGRSQSLLPRRCSRFEYILNFSMIVVFNSSDQFVLVMSIVARFVLFVVVPNSIAKGLRTTSAGAIFCLVISVLLALLKLRFICDDHYDEHINHSLCYYVCIAFLIYFTITELRLEWKENWKECFGQLKTVLLCLLVREIYWIGLVLSETHLSVLFICVGETIFHDIR